MPRTLSINIVIIVLSILACCARVAPKPVAAATNTIATATRTITGVQRVDLMGSAYMSESPRETSAEMIEEILGGIGRNGLLGVIIEDVASVRQDSDWTRSCQVSYRAVYRVPTIVSP